MKNLVRGSLIVLSVSLTACTQDTSYYASNPIPNQNMRYVQTGANNTPNAPQYAQKDLAGTELASADRATTSNVGSRIMDSNDKNKMSHALDNPLGKATTWVNPASGVTYTVTPTRKVTVNGNSFCRSYTTSAARGTQTRVTSGTACVDQTGVWQETTG